MLEKLVTDFPNPSIHIKKVDVTNQVIPEADRKERQRMADTERGRDRQRQRQRERETERDRD